MTDILFSVLMLLVPWLIFLLVFIGISYSVMILIKNKRADKAADTQPEKVKKGTDWFLVFFMFVLASLLPWMMALWLSFFAFDAPGSEKDHPEIWLFVLPIWFYPLFVVLFGSIAFLLRFWGHQRGARIAMALPLVTAAIFTFFITIVLIFYV